MLGRDLPTIDIDDVLRLGVIGISNWGVDVIRISVETSKQHDLIH